jgi:hypothetical protein
MKTLIFVCLLMVCQISALRGVWQQLTPRGEQPHKVNKPNVVHMGGDKLVMFNGVQDDCNTGVTTSYNNSRVYLYDISRNSGKFIDATGDIPDTRLFAATWHDGERSVIVGGGVFYNVQFSIIDFKAFDPLYKLTLQGNNRATWTILHPTGDVPSPRTEMSVIQNPNDEDEVYLYGGVSLQGPNFVSYGAMYKYSVSRNHFTLIHPGSPVDDGSDGLPKSRYHAAPYWLKDGHRSFIEVHQGVHAGSTSPISEELLDTWRFNVRTRQWTQVFPNPPIGFTRRHGIDFQIKERGQTYFCTTLGDTTHLGEETQGCLFPIVTINTTMCSNTDDNGGQGAWFTVPTRGTIVNSKYPGGVTVGDKVYMMGGEHEVYLDPIHNIQVFNEGVSVLGLH